MRRADPYPILETRIRTGVYPAGSWLAPERELAEELGVHRQAIRRAVARLADRGLIERRPGYRPVVLESEAGTMAPNTVALLMGNEPLFHAFQQVLRGCEQELRLAGYRLVFVDTLGRDSSTTREHEFRALDSIVERPAAGLIIWCEDPVASLSRLEKIHRQGVPIVAIDRVIPGLETDFVGVDNFQAAHRVVEHLWDLGHRRIALLTHALTVSTIADRETGFRSACNRLGVDFDSSILFRLPRWPINDESAFEEIAGQLFAMDQTPTALFAVNDILAWRLMRCITATGRSVPKDIAIVGFDDIEAWAIHKPMLTTIRQPYDGIGRHAAQVLLQRLRNPTSPTRHLLLDTSLVVRSTTVPDQDDPGSSSQSVFEPGMAFAPAHAPAALR